MQQAWSVIQELESTSSRLAKEAIIEREAIANNNELFLGFKLALDSLVTFGVKQIPVHKGPSGPGYNWALFLKELRALSNRDVTGNAARDLINVSMKLSTIEQWNDWYRRILIKDLRAGLSEVTINKVVKNINPNYTIPVFECQLAFDSKKHESKLSGEKIIETKLDGTRVLTIVYPDNVMQFSRNGKELVNFNKITEQFRTISDTIKEPMVFDGEIMSSSFQDLMKQLRRKENVETSDAVLHLFDMIPLTEFKRGVYEVSQTQRSNDLRDWYTPLSEQLPNVQLLGQETVNLDTEDGKTKFTEINKLALDNGYEGLLIKDPTAPYECKRSTAWLKLKPVISVDLEIIDVEEGTGKNAGRLGAMVCKGIDEGRLIQVNVGSGLSDNDRIDFWQHKRDLIGQIIECYGDAVTQNQDNTYSIRFPRFSRFRGFQPGEKL
jgi:DNA ligase-1